jgi:hypothetical protein
MSYKCIILQTYFEAIFNKNHLRPGVGTKRQVDNLLWCGYEKEGERLLERERGGGEKHFINDLNRPLSLTTFSAPSFFFNENNNKALRTPFLSKN